MRIYKVNLEHKKFGLNWSARSIAARTAEQAIRKVKRDLRSYERIESVELIAAED